MIDKTTSRERVLKIFWKDCVLVTNVTIWRYCPAMINEHVIPRSSLLNGGGRVVRRVRLVMTVLLVAAGLFVAASAIGGVDPAEAQTEDGVLFGAYAQPEGSQTAIQAMQSLESDLGTRLPIVRSFGDWDDNLDNRFNNWAVDGGRRLMISVAPQRNNGSQISWRAIANARPGSTIHNEMIALAQDVKSLDGEVWFSFHHEPEASTRTSFGDSGDFKAAWRAIHDVFRQQGADVEWVWTMTSWSFEVSTSDRRSAGKWYPGDSYVDMLGADPYNWNQCRNSRERWQELERVITPFLEFAKQHPSKELVLPEFASAEGSSGAKAAWLERAADFLKKPENASRFAAIIYFHDEHPGASRCNWWLDSSSSSLNAARDIAQDPFFKRNNPNASPTPTPAPRPTPPRNTATSGCTVRSTGSGDVVEWSSRGSGWGYNIRRDSRWVGETSASSFTNRGASSGTYVVIARGGGQRIDTTCTRN